MTVILRDNSNDNTREFDSIEEAKDRKQDLMGLGAKAADLEIIENSEEPTEDNDESQSTKTDPEAEVESQPKTAEPVQTVAPEELSKDPIGFLESINSDFVNTIKGTAAISKQGFRYIQREFEITTEAEVVQWSDDPLGCVVWAKAELPNSIAAEAHGEGYQFESDVSDNEFVRYADSRAKSRALSDLTAAGAIAVEELSTD